MKSIFLLALTTIAAQLPALPDTVIDRGPHYDVHEVVSQVVNGGGVESVTNRFTILQPGLNYFSETENKWIPSSNAIDIQQNGASYKRGPFKLDFAPNINDAAVAIALHLPDGRSVKIKTIGVALTAANGDSVWLGELKDSNGLLDGNTIIYPDSFTGLKADIVVKVSTGKYESDVVLREQLTPPQTFGFDPATATVEIWHKLVETPSPEVAVGHIRRHNGTIDDDEQMGFGEMFIGEGAAFLLGTNRAPVSAPEGAIKVAKERFNDADNVQYLIEKIPYAEAAAQLQSLPARQEARVERDAVKIQMEKLRKVAARTGGKRSRNLPVSVADSATIPAGAKDRDRTVAAITRGSLPQNPGFVMDYTVLVGVSNFRFRGDNVLLHQRSEPYRQSGS